MPSVRRVVSAGLTGLAGTACLACCLVPTLLTTGVLGGAGWVIAGRWTPGIAVSLVVLAALAWWRTNRHRRAASARRRELLVPIKLTTAGSAGAGRPGV